MISQDIIKNNAWLNSEPVPENNNSSDNENLNSRIRSLFLKMKRDGFNPCQNTYLKETKDKGLGVFAGVDIEKNSIIEICHALRLWRRAYHSDFSIIKYAYWHNLCECKDCHQYGPHGMILFGNGSVYNSASSYEEANADYFTILDLPAAYFIAKNKIKKDEEILTWWGQGYFDSWCKKK